MSDEEFTRMVIYYWKDKADPTRLVSWDEERCKRVMPAFYKSWDDYRVSEDILNRVADSYE